MCAPWPAVHPRTSTHPRLNWRQCWLDYNSDYFYQVAPCAEVRPTRERRRTFESGPKLTAAPEYCPAIHNKQIHGKSDSKPRGQLDQDPSSKGLLPYLTKNSVPANRYRLYEPQAEEHEYVAEPSDASALREKWCYLSQHPAPLRQ